MQFNWLHFCGICWMISLKVQPNTALGCNHQSICMPQLQPLCSAALAPIYYPEGMKAQVSHVQSIKPHSILTTTRNLNQGSPGPQSRVVRVLVVTIILLLPINRERMNILVQDTDQLRVLFQLCTRVIWRCWSRCWKNAKIKWNLNVKPRMQNILS